MIPWIVLGGLAACVLFAAWVEMFGGWRPHGYGAGKNVRSVPAPERAIVQRVPTEFGENVRLECGHTVSLIYHRMQSIECKECGESSGERPDRAPLPPEAASPNKKEN